MLSISVNVPFSPFLANAFVMLQMLGLHARSWSLKHGGGDVMQSSDLILFSLKHNYIIMFRYMVFVVSLKHMVFLFSVLVFQLRSSIELDQDILNDCLTIQPLQPPASPQGTSESTVRQSPGPVHDIYTGMVWGGVVKETLCTG